MLISSPGTWITNKYKENSRVSDVSRDVLYNDVLLPIIRLVYKTCHIRKIALSGIFFSFSEDHTS